MDGFRGLQSPMNVFVVSGNFRICTCHFGGEVLGVLAFAKKGDVNLATSEINYSTFDPISKFAQTSPY